VAALDQVENRGLASIGAAQVSFKEIRIVCNYPFFLRSELLAFLNVSFQFMVDTRSGLFGLSVLRRVVQVWNIVLVPAQILGQQTEDEGAEALDRVKNLGLVSFGNAQFMVDIRSGLIGLSVAGHVMEEGKSVIDFATTPRLQTKEEIVVV